MNACVKTCLLLSTAAGALEGQSAAKEHCDPPGQFLERFVIVDSRAFDVGMRARFDSLESSRGSTSHVDTALVWSPRSARWFRRRWLIRLSASANDGFEVYHDRIYWRKVLAPSESTKTRFAASQSTAPCLSGGQLKRFYHAPSHAVTTSEVVQAQIEPSYVTLPWLEFGLPRDLHTDLEAANPRAEKLPLLYEGSVAPAFLVRPRKQPWLLSVSPKVVIRQFFHGSAPVPPPSYMPRASLYYWGRGVRSLPGMSYSYPYVWGMISHHSNGQEGSPIDAATGRPNYLTGNFSANFYELGYRDTKSDPGLGLASVEFAVRYQPDAWGDSTQLHYGHGRIRTAVEAFLPVVVGAEGYANGRLEVTWMGGPMDRTFGTFRKRLNTALTFSVKPAIATDFALFANLYNGQDYYNIRYDRRIRVFRLGIIANPLHFLFEVPDI